MTTYYSEEHEWITVEGDIATIGITAHAAEQLGDIVFVDQKEEGDEFESGDEIGVIESVKAASEIFAPVDGEIWIWICWPLGMKSRHLSRSMRRGATSPCPTRCLKPHKS